MRSIFATAAILMLLTSPVRAENLIINGGFEDGTYSSTLGVPPFGGTNIVPNGWTPSLGWVTPGNFNNVSGGGAHSGQFAVSMGNDPGYPLGSISQTFEDAPGATYNVSFYLASIWWTGYFSADVDGIVGTFVVLPIDDTPRSAYELHSFTFIGTGADTLTFTAVNDDRSYALDDVSVTLIAASVPEPTTWAMILLGFVGTGMMKWNRSRRRPKYARGPAAMP